MMKTLKRKLDDTNEAVNLDLVTLKNKLFQQEQNYLVRLFFPSFYYLS